MAARPRYHWKDDGVSPARRMLASLRGRLALARAVDAPRWRSYWRAQWSGLQAAARGDICVASEVVLCPRCDRYLDPSDDWLMHLCKGNSAKPGYRWDGGHREVLYLRRGRWLRPFCSFFRDGRGGEAWRL